MLESEKHHGLLAHVKLPYRKASYTLATKSTSTRSILLKTEVDWIDRTVDGIDRVDRSVNSVELLNLRSRPG